MEVLDKIRWFSNENSLSASLMRFHASIHVHQSNEKIIFQVTITDENMDKLIISFPTLEEAFSFVQSIVNTSWTMEDIINSCRENYNGKVPKVKKRKQISSNVVKRENIQ